MDTLQHTQQLFNGVKPEDIAVIPPVKASMDSAVQRVQGRGKMSDFARENDFQSLLPDADFIDVNDPSNEVLLHLYSKRALLSDRDVFQLQLSCDFAALHGTIDGVTFANYARFKETMRMQLLRLRSMKPFLFNDPIPLSETAIKSSELYKRILASEMDGDSESAPQNNEFDQKFLLIGNKDSANAIKTTSFLQKVRNSQTSQSRNKRRKRLTTASVVIETDYFAPAEPQDLSLLFERKRGMYHNSFSK